MRWGPQCKRASYIKTLGLDFTDEEAGSYAKFNSGAGFVCLERMGSELYPSRNQGVLFFEVADIQGTMDTIGRDGRSSSHAPPLPSLRDSELPKQSALDS
jgi:hypothetical protein